MYIKEGLAALQHLVSSGWVENEKDFLPAALFGAPPKKKETCSD